MIYIQIKGLGFLFQVCIENFEKHFQKDVEDIYGVHIVVPLVLTY